MKFLSILFFLSFISVGAFGQINKYDIGATGGMGISDFFGTSRDFFGNKLYIDLYKPAPGYMGGLFFQYNFKRTFSIRTEMAIERKSSNIGVPFTDDFGNTFETEKARERLDYLIVPILVRATKGKRIKYFINTGPYLGYLLNYSYVVNLVGQPKKTFFFNEKFKNLDAGIAAGFGFFVPVKTKLVFSWEVRNNLGLINISKYGKNAGNVKINSTNLLLGFTINLE